MEFYYQSLVERAKKDLPGDTTSFAILAGHYYDFVRSVGYHIVGNAMDADTVTQDVMLRVFHHLPALHDSANFEAWLRRIIANVAYTQISREIREREKVQNLVDLAPTPPLSTKPLAEFNNTDGTFVHWLEGLNVEERSILVFRFKEDLRFTDIAIRMGLKVSATKMRYYRALDKIRSQFTGGLAA